MLSHSLIGAGARTTVLLHGFLGSGRNLRTLALEWSERDPTRSFLLVDLTGHGDSPPLPERPTLAALASDVMATARSAGMNGPLSLVGHSLGGRVALECVRAHASEVSDLVLLDITPAPIDPAVSESGEVLKKLLRAPEEAVNRSEMRQALLKEGLSAPIAEWLLTNLTERDGRYRWRIDRAALQRFHAGALGEDLWSLAEPPRVPTLCVRGRRSPYVSDALASRMSAAGIAVETVDAGHYVHVEALEPLLDVLGSWRAAL